VARLLAGQHDFDSWQGLGIFLLPPRPRPEGLWRTPKFQPNAYRFPFSGSKADTMAFGFHFPFLTDLRPGSPLFLRQACNCFSILYWHACFQLPSLFEKGRYSSLYSDCEKPVFSSTLWLQTSVFNSILLATGLHSRSTFCLRYPCI